MHPGEVHPTAIIDPSATILDGAKIDAYVVIGENVEIGEDVVINALTCVGPDTTIGHRAKIGAGVIIGSDCRIDDDAVIWAGSTVVKSHIGASAYVGPGSVVCGCEMEDGMKLPPGTVYEGMMSEE